MTPGRSHTKIKRGESVAKRRKTVRAGEYVREVLYTAPEPRDGERVRAEKSKMTSEARRVMNARASRNALAERIYANFGRGDKFVTLTYRTADLPAKWAVAVECFTKYIDALRRRWKKKGRELKYIYITENKHGDGRIHHHLIINASDEDFNLLRSLWAYGDQVDIQPVNKYGVAYGDQLADYMMKERKPVGARAWTGSLNLIKPTVASTFVPSDTKLRVPKGAFVLEREERINTYGGYSYVCCILPKVGKRPPENGNKRYLDSGQSLAVLGL